MDDYQLLNKPHTHTHKPPNGLGDILQISQHSHKSLYEKSLKSATLVD